MLPIEKTWRFLRDGEGGCGGHACGSARQTAREFVVAVHPCGDGGCFRVRLLMDSPISCDCQRQAIVAVKRIGRCHKIATDPEQSEESNR